MLFAAHLHLAENLEDILGIQRFQEDRRAIADGIRPPNDDQWDWTRLDSVIAEMRGFHSGATESMDTHDAPLQGPRCEESLLKG